ncbi:MAG: hypothetical protein U0835_18665 [Isosphaeraceae bacterium]
MPRPPPCSPRSRPRNGLGEGVLLPDGLLVEEYPHAEGLTYAFHAPLSRSAWRAPAAVSA